MSTTNNKVVNISSKSPRRRRPTSNSSGARKNKPKKRANNPRPKSNAKVRSIFPHLQTKALSEYLQTLTNPIETGPVRIGFGTMVPTQLYTGFYRSTTTANADGTLSIILIPSLVNMVSVNNSGAAGTTWVNNPASNAAAISAVCNEARVVSGGLSIMPLIAATATPGTAFVRCVPSNNLNISNALSNTNIIASPSNKMGFARSGASGIILPVDPVSFQFAVATVTGYTASTNYGTSSIFIALTGLPAGASVNIEATLNLETVQTETSATTSQINIETNTATQPSLADHFPSLDNMWSAAKSYIPSATRVNEGFAGYSKLVHTLNTARNVYQGRRGMQQLPPDNLRQLYAA